MTTSETLAEAIDNIRDLLYFYLSKLDKSFWHENPTVNGQQLNSVAWLEKFSLGKPAVATNETPSINEIKESLANVHTQSIEVIKSLTDKDLEFKKGDSKVQIIYHHIRHEGGHIGHIGLLCKILGAKTI